MKARDLLALALILVTSALPVGAQPKRDDPVQADVLNVIPPQGAGSREARMSNDACDLRASVEIGPRGLSPS